MILISPKKMASDPFSWSTKHWISFCNTLLLLLVAFLCGIVLYEIRNLDQRFISVIDSSRVSIDLMSVDLIDMQPQPHWQDVVEGLAIYSAFHNPNSTGDKFIRVIGSSMQNEIRLEEIRCVVKYEDGEISVANVSIKKFDKCSTAHLHCLLQRDFLPSKVALVSVGNTIPKQWVNVEIVPKKTSPILESTNIVCVKPLKENVTALDIDNFLNRSEGIGMSQFYFYNYNASEKILDTLSHLISKGHFVRLLPWGRKLDSFIDCSGNLSEFIQDCVYRSQVNNKQKVYVSDMSNTLKRVV